MAGMVRQLLPPKLPRSLWRFGIRGFIRTEQQHYHACAETHAPNIAACHGLPCEP